MSVFDSLLSRIFSNRDLSSTATYVPLGGSAVSIPAIMITPAAVNIPANVDVFVPAFAADVLERDVAQPKEGDQIILEGNSFTVSSFENDSLKKVWRLYLSED